MSDPVEPTPVREAKVQELTLLMRVPLSAILVGFVVAYFMKQTLTPVNEAQRMLIAYAPLACSMLLGSAVTPLFDLYLKRAKEKRDPDSHSPYFYLSPPYSPQTVRLLAGLWGAVLGAGIVAFFGSFGEKGDPFWWLVLVTSVAAGLAYYLAVPRKRVFRELTSKPVPEFSR